MGLLGDEFIDVYPLDVKRNQEDAGLLLVDLKQSIHNALILHLLLQVGVRRQLENVLRLAFQQNRKGIFDLVLDKVMVAQWLFQLVLL